MGAMKEVNQTACSSCGYYGRDTGYIMVECCSRCNVIHNLGLCRVCNGTGIIQNPEGSNREVVRQACEASGGYLCGARSIW